MKKQFCGALVGAAMALVGTQCLADNVKIGVVMGLSGPPVIVDFGESYLQGIQQAVTEYQANKPMHKVETVVLNDEANPQRAVSLVQRLISSDRVSVIIGTVNSGNVLAFAPLVQQAQIPLMVGPTTATEITRKFINEKPSYVFRCSMVEQYQVDAVVEYALKRSKKIGLIHDTSGYGLFTLAALQKSMAEHKAEFIAVESSAVTATDMTPQMLKLKNSGAEVVLAFHTSIELMYRALQKIEWKPSIVGPWAYGSNMIANIVGKDTLEGTVMAQAFVAGTLNTKAFEDRMAKSFGEKYRWPVVAALGYDATRLVLGAIDRAGADPAKIRDALENTDGFKGVTGIPDRPYSTSDHECLGKEQVFMGAWKGGQIVRVAP